MDIPRLFGEVKQLDLPAIASLGGTTAAGSLGLWEPPGLIKTKRDGGRWTVDGGWTVGGRCTVAITGGPPSLSQCLSLSLTLMGCRPMRHLTAQRSVLLYSSHTAPSASSTHIACFAPHVHLTLLCSRLWQTTCD